MTTQTVQARIFSRRMLAIAAVSAIALSMIWVVTPAFGTHVEPELILGQEDCGDLGEFDHEFKIEAPEDGPITSGTYEDPASDFSVDITVNETPAGQTFDFEANLGVDAVFAKGGPQGNLYEYIPAEAEDDGLHAPANESGKWANLSHISFCFNDVPEESVPESASESEAEQSVAESASESEAEQSVAESASEEESVAESVAESVPAESGEQSVAAGTGTPAASTPDGALPLNGVSPLATIVFSLILLGSLGTLAYANVKAVRSR